MLTFYARMVYGITLKNRELTQFSKCLMPYACVGLTIEYLRGGEISDFRHVQDFFFKPLPFKVGFVNVKPTLNDPLFPKFWRLQLYGISIH